MVTAAVNTETGEVTELPAPTSLPGKLARVALEIERVPKRGWNDFHKYHFATESDIKEAVRKLLAPFEISTSWEFQLLHLKEWKTPKGKSTLVAVTHARLTLTDGVTGNSITTEGLGSGDDPLDKAVMKSVTAAAKYALLNAFLIPTGDDPDAGSKHQVEEPPKATDADKQALQERITALSDANRQQIKDTLIAKKISWDDLTVELLGGVTGWVVACEKVEAEAAEAAAAELDSQAQEAAAADEGTPEQ